MLKQNTEVEELPFKSILQKEKENNVVTTSAMPVCVCCLFAETNPVLAVLPVLPAVFPTSSSQACCSTSLLNSLPLDLTLDQRPLPLTTSVLGSQLPAQTAPDLQPLRSAINIF